MGEVRPWLPETAMRGELAVHDILNLIDSWSADWLAQSVLIGPRGWEAADSLSLDPTNLIEHRASPRFRLLLASDAMLRLASAIFDRCLSEKDLRKPCDRVVIRQVATAAIDDLADRLTVFFGPPESAEASAMRGTSYELLLHLGDLTPLVVIEVPSNVLVTLVQKACGRPRDRSALAPAGSAVAQQEVSISVSLGRSNLPLGELAAIGVGDVLQLETALGSALDIHVEGKCCGRDAASIGTSDGGFVLQIERSADQW